MKNLTPTKIREALARRNSEMTGTHLSTEQLVHNILARRRRRRNLHRRVIAAVMTAAAAIIIGIVFTFRPSFYAKPQPEVQSESAAHVIAALARAGIEGECSMTETRREDSDGTTIVSCRVVVRVSKYDCPDQLLIGQQLASVVATYDSVITQGATSTSLITEFNYTGGLRTVCSLR